MKKADEPQGPPATAVLRLKVGGTDRVFDIDDPKLPNWIDKRAFALRRLPL